MKGLLLKDFYMARKYCRPFVMIVIVFIAVSLVSPANVFMVVYPVIIASMIPMTLMSYEEQCGWTMYCGILPCTKAQIVSVKYLFGLIVVTFVTVLTGLAKIAYMVGNGTVFFMDVINLMAMLWFVGLVGPSIVLPFVFKLGAEKGRTVYYIVVGLLCAIGTIIGIEGVNFEVSVRISGLWIPVLSVVAGIVIFLLSWRMAVRFYKEREI